MEVFSFELVVVRFPEIAQASSSLLGCYHHQCFRAGLGFIFRVFQNPSSTHDLKEENSFLFLGLLSCPIYAPSEHMLIRITISIIKSACSSRTVQYRYCTRNYCVLERVLGRSWVLE